MEEERIVMPWLTASENAPHTSAYVSIRQHTSAPHTSAYVSIRQRASEYVSIRQRLIRQRLIRQHTLAYVVEEQRIVMRMLLVYAA